MGPLWLKAWVGAPRRRARPRPRPAPGGRSSRDGCATDCSSSSSCSSSNTSSSPSSWAPARISTSSASSTSGGSSPGSPSRPDRSLCYALLTRTLLPGGGPGISKLVRIVLATTAVAHVIPGGAAGGAGVGYRLLTANGVEGTDAGFAMATEAIGSALVLNVMLWLALLISIPLAGLHPIYVITALVGLLALFGSRRPRLRADQRWRTRRAQWFGRSVGSIPRVGADRLERLVHQVGDSVVHLGRDRALLKRAVVVGGAQLAPRRRIAVVVCHRLRALRRSRSSSSRPMASPTCSAPSPSLPEVSESSTSRPPPCSSPSVSGAGSPRWR